MNLYGDTTNEALLSLIGTVHGSVLDIGCGTGRWAPELRRRGASMLVGVDVSREALDSARTRYDRVVEASVDSLSLRELGNESFKLIVMADVLEHLIDPWSALRHTHAWATPDARLAVSVPNVSHRSIVRSLVWAGEFAYSDSGGPMDRSHLRWFTQRSLKHALEHSGWQPLRWLRPTEGGARHLGGIARGRLDHLLLRQIMVIAERAQTTC